MAITEANTKRVSDLQEILTAPDNSMLILQDGAVTKKISSSNFKKDLKGSLTQLSAQLAVLNSQNAGAHNGIYRGKNLGSSVTAAQYEAIAAGTFDDLYIGDYWKISNINWRIAAFDYYLNTGDTNCTKHHVVILPDSALYNAQMNNTASGKYESGEVNTTEGGYIGSDMYKTGLDQAKTTIKGIFGDHVLKHRVYLVNAVSSGRPSAGAWCDSEVELMNEQMVYGGPIFMPMANGSSVFANYRVEKSQLPLFALEPSRITNRQSFWLRDVVDAYAFAHVNYNGIALSNPSSHPFGVRPAFSIS